MRVALNLMFVGQGVAGGRVYAEGLLTGFAALEDDTEFVVIVREGISLPTLPKRFRIVRAPVAGDSTLWRTLWEYHDLPKLLSRERCNLFHALGSISPAPPCGIRFVLTIHDLIYRRFPASMPFGHRWFCRIVQPHSARRADRVIVPSHSSFEDVARLLSVKRSRLRTIHYGPGNRFGPAPNDTYITDTLARLNIDRPYILSVARGYPHKNLDGLLRAVALLPDVSLVLVGEPYLMGTRLVKLIDELRLKERVHFTDYVTNDELHAIYAGAELFAFPSLCEGFGLPVLEAMSVGVPIVASDSSAVPEAVGDAGVITDARNPEAFAAALRRVWGDARLRCSLRDRGFARVREFDWKTAAQETLAVYRELA